MFGRRKDNLQELIRSEGASLRELTRSQQEDSKRYWEKRDAYWEKRDEEYKAYWKKRDEEYKAYWKKRDEEWQRYEEKRDAEFRTTQADLHRLREEAEAREEETREFNREILLRNEKVYKAVIAQVEENTEQIRANTQAVLSALDRFNGSGGLAA